MHDFIQLQSFSATRHPFAPRPSVPEWVQRGLMRSFGEDDLPACRPSPTPTLTHRRRLRSAGPSRISNFKS